jgi:hypothetical protein
VPPGLPICPACDRFVWSSETTCPFCHVHLAEARAVEAEEHRRRQALMDEVLASIKGPHPAR